LLTVQRANAVIVNTTVARSEKNRLIAFNATILQGGFVATLSPILRAIEWQAARR
jgi:hypothetical protein